MCIVLVLVKYHFHMKQYKEFTFINITRNYTRKIEWKSQWSLCGKFWKVILILGLSGNTQGNLLEVLVVALLFRWFVYVTPTCLAFSFSYLSPFTPWFYDPRTRTLNIQQMSFCCKQQQKFKYHRYFLKTFLTCIWT